MPRAAERGGVGGDDRIFGSMLIARRGGNFLPAYCDGSDGNGGTSTGVESSGPELVDGRRGDGSRNVLAVIELELFLRWSGSLLAERRFSIGLTCD